MTRVLFFSAYASWGYHTALEATWAHALKLRGAEVQFVACDGLSQTCDVYRDNLNPRDEMSCVKCQASTAGVFAGLSMPYDWLGTYLPLGTREKATAWTETLADEELLEARWRDMDVGKWAATSAHNQFRSAELNFSDPKIVKIVRDLLVGTVVILEAMNVLLDTHRPDTLVLLNGRFFAHWTAIEIAKQKGIRFITHERGFHSDTIRFSENSRTHELDGMRELWDEWKDVPLLPDEVADVAEILENRRMGLNFSRLSFSPTPQTLDSVRQVLDLDSRPIVAIFTSSDDETAAFPERRRGAFPNSADFLPAVLELARHRPAVQFVIRIHPNTQKREAGTNEDALRHAEDIREQAPENVCVVMPLDDISSYTLADLADVGIVYASTIGLEMAVTGKPVLCMAQATYSHTGAAQQIAEPAQLGPALDRSLASGIDIEQVRTAMRWTYRYFREYSIPFELVRQPQINGPASLSYRNVAELAPGRSKILDSVCHFLAGESNSVLAGVEAAERQRELEPETATIEHWLQLVHGSGHGVA